MMEEKIKEGNKHVWNSVRKKRIKENDTYLNTAVKRKWR
jgi:hypothetical protein